MVARYYDPNFSDPVFMERDSKGVYWTRDNLACVSPAYLNNRPKGPNDWVFYDPPAEAGFASVKKSLQAGDPVIIYTKPGAVYGNSQHIFVIVGYDPADDTYWVNNPTVGACECWGDTARPGPTKTPNGRKATEEHLKRYLGGPRYGGPYRYASFLIRGTYK